ncbi:MAG TPA: hypothetical protein PL185_05375 [Flavobacteriales bacterium]|nr:hypothetical protein [Flavobacteriales bacterium]HPH81978.1 hypothetical protein [Flavobacteriales bacterium]
MRSFLFLGFSVIVLSCFTQQVSAQSLPTPVRFQTLQGKVYQADGIQGSSIKFDSIKPFLFDITATNPNPPKELYRIHEDKLFLGKNGRFITFSTSRDTLYFQPSGTRYIKVN